MQVNATKCQGYSFYCFWVIEGNPTMGGEWNYPPPTNIRVNGKEIFKFTASNRKVEGPA